LPIVNGAQGRLRAVIYCFSLRISIARPGAFAMSDKSVIRIHKTWEDYFGMALGAAIGLSPWFPAETLPDAVYTNAAIVGVALLLVAQFEFIRSRRWEEIAELACGLWMIASPTIYGYARSGQARVWHWLLGAAVVALAALEYWQRKDA
jgi:hypothetical protein